MAKSNQAVQVAQLWAQKRRKLTIQRQRARAGAADLREVGAAVWWSIGEAGRAVQGRAGRAADLRARAAKRRDKGTAAKRLSARVLRLSGEVLVWRAEGLGSSSARKVSGRERRAASGAAALVSVASARAAAPVVNLLSAVQLRIAAAVGLPVREVAGGYAESKRQAARHGAGRRRRERELVEAFAPSFLVRSYLDSLARSAGRMAGRGAKVSATSIEEAGEAGRSAVLSWCMRAGGVGADGLPVQLSKATLRPDSVRAGRLTLFAKRAASASLRAGWVCGMSGRAVELAKLRAGAPEVVFGGHVLDSDGVAIGGEHWTERQTGDGSAADLADLVNAAGRAWGGHRGSLSAGDKDRDGARAWGRALTLARAVRRLQGAELARLAAEHARKWAVPSGSSARAFGRSASATRTRFAKVGRVLVRVALGESLELACGLEGFGWDGKRGESSGLSRSMRELGLAKGLGLSVA